MPPNSHHLEDNTIPASFTNSFWSKDKSGMNQLLGYMKSTHDDLDIIYTIYTQRSKLEQEFGEKLLSLSSIQETDEADKKQGVPAAYQTITIELQKTANSHLELSQKLSSKVASEIEQKLDEYKLLLEKWTKMLDELYNERQEKTIELLKIRAKYLKEHDMSKGQSTQTMEKLKSQYKALVAEVDELSQEWNTTWKDACEVMEAVEEDRVEFLKSNVWEYANLASARLLIEDEWCETIRKQLENCSAEQEIERCISIYGTGTKIPTTNEYVGEQMKEQKKKMAAQQHQQQIERSSSSAAPPKPPAKPQRRQQEEQQDQPTRPRDKKQQEHVGDDRSSNRQRQVNKQREDVLEGSNDSHQHQSRSSNSRYQQQQPKQISEEKGKEQEQRHSRSPQREERVFNNDDRIPKISRNMPQQPPKEEEQPFSSSRGDAETMNQIRSRVSDNAGSTAARGQIKRKPLNKSLMDQVSNQMAMARQQRELEQEENHNRCSSPESSVRGNNPTTTKATLQHKKTGSDGSLDSLLKTFEVVDPVTGIKAPSPPPIAAVSDEARFRRQPSEYKPDTGSIPTRRGTVNNNMVLQEMTSSNEMAPPPLSSTSSTTNSSSNSNSSSTIQDPYTHPVAAPKSPRPPAQQISADAQQQAEYAYDQNYQQPVDMHNSQYPQQQQQSYQPSPSMMHHQIPDQNAMYHRHQQQQQYMGHQQPQYMGQQNMNQRPRSPMMQSMHSPMMQPQRSPMIQPQRSPMMQPMHSPMMQHQQQQDHFGTQRGSLPPPITIPTTNYGVTPQPSPNMAYANATGGISPGGVLPPPNVYNQQPPARPTQYSDGRNILFWVRAKYDYTTSDQGELSFKANTLIGVLEADMTQQTWWHGAIWDEYRYTWSSVAGSIPSNFMANA